MIRKQYSEDGGVMTTNKAIAPFRDEEPDGDHFNRMAVLEESIGNAKHRGEGANRRMKQKAFEVDLSKLQGEGDFPCPRCGIIISPDDESEETYTVLETKGDEDSLEEVTIQCKKCESIIQLRGFDKLEEVESESNVQISEPQTGSKPGLRTIHTLSIEGKAIGRVTIEYLQEEDVKAFSKINRALKSGDAFQARIFVDSSLGVTVDSLGSKGLAEIVKVIRRRGKGIRERDIFVVAIEGGREKLIGRAESLVQESAD
jgi:hypothetical protein